MLVAPALFTVPNNSHAQTFPDSLRIMYDTDNGLEGLEDGNGDPLELAEILASIADHPLDINMASAEELGQIPAITPLIAHNIVRFREQVGAFRDVNELAQVEGISEHTLREAGLYLTAGARNNQVDPVASQPQPSRRTLRLNMLQRVGQRVDRRASHLSSAKDYLGSPVAMLSRLQAQWGEQFSFNLTLEKDAYEPFRWNRPTNTYGYDYLSGHAAIKNWGRVETLVLGDFAANFGQGVILSRSAAFGKGAETVRPVSRSGAGILPYGATEENSFFRGIGATVRLLPSITISTLISRRSLDASLTRPDSASLPRISSLGHDGLHRSLSEIDRKDRLQENFLGGNLAFRRSHSEFGVIAYHSRFSIPFERSSQPYKRYAFQGRQASMLGAYASIVAGSHMLFAELARSPGNIFGGVGGVQFQIADRIEAVVIGRRYPPKFVSLHGCPFGEQTCTAQNETGIYTGIRLAPRRRWTVSAYFDQYYFPWLHFQTPRPGAGSDALISVSYEPRKWLLLKLQARSETQEQRASIHETSDRILAGVRPVSRQSVRFQGDYLFSERLRLRFRIETTRYMKPETRVQRGLLLYQDIKWLALHRVRVDFRYAVFDADGYDARVYAYENDVRYAFSMPSFVGRGQRTYVLLTFSPSNRLSIQGKLGWTRFDRNELRTDEPWDVYTPSVREYRLQLQWKH